PHRARAFPHGRPGATRVLLCPGGGDCGRNVLQFWHCCSAGGLVASLPQPGSGGRNRTRSRKQDPEQGGCFSAPCSRREEGRPCLKKWLFPVRNQKRPTSPGRWSCPGSCRPPF